MNRDRSRPAIEKLLFESLFAVVAGRIDSRIFIATDFARAAGVSRQALYQTHRDIVNVLTYLRKARSEDPEVPELQKRIKALKEENTDLEKKLQGAVKQNRELAVDIYNLRSQIKQRGLSIVPRQTEWESGD
ncbi:hypothetical protein [Paraburkholderia tropica]|uniref:hypothetical protein n=1 Tax=Paraburkholderia tropica TaxID=92647 RepID=UPI002ABD2209|nr:hypothetical protein [Paraburkholderia tropica]